MSVDSIARALAARAARSAQSLADTGLWPANATADEVAAMTQVATNARICDSCAATNKSFMVRSAHMMRASGVTKLAIAIPTWYWERTPSKLELPSGGGATFRAAIEYPEGTLTTLAFSGQVRPYQRDMGLLVSDLAAVAIPAGARFWVRVWCLTAGTILFGTWAQNGFSGGTATEKLAVGASAQTDYTQTAAWPIAANGVGWWPAAVIAPVAHASVACVGDSKTGGIGDTPDATGDMGDSPRGVGAACGYINMGSSGDTLSGFRTASRQRLALTRFTRNAVCGAAVNDIANGRTLAQVQADMIWLWSTLKGSYGQKRVFQLTITPETVSAVAITALTASGTTATATIPAAQAAALSVGQQVIVAGAVPAGYNGTVAVTAVSAGQVSYTLPGGASGLAAATTTGTLSDQWASAAFQTASPCFSIAGNGTREQLNDWLRDGAPMLAGAAAAAGGAAAGTIRASLTGASGHPLAAVFDVADQAETARNSGKWRTDGTVGKWTADGIHPSQYGYQQIAASGAIAVAKLAT